MEKHICQVLKGHYHGTTFYFTIGIPRFHFFYAVLYSNFNLLSSVKLMEQIFLRIMEKWFSENGPIKNGDGYSDVTKQSVTFPSAAVYEIFLGYELSSINLSICGSP